MNQPTLQPTRSGPKQRQQQPQGKQAATWQPKRLVDFHSRFKPTLTVKKFVQPIKCYRLIWRLGDSAWLSQENLIPYRKRYGKGGAVEAGEALANILGVRFEQ